MSSLRDSYQKQLSQRYYLKTKKHRAAQISLPKPCIGRKQRETLTKKKNCSIWKRTSLTRLHIIGRTNIGLVNQDTSTVFTLDMSGTSITKRITSMSFHSSMGFHLIQFPALTTHPRKLFKDTRFVGRLDRMMSDSRDISLIFSILI